VMYGAACRLFCGCLLILLAAPVLAKCPKIVFDVDRGTVNGLKATASQKTITTKLPSCYATVDPEHGGVANHGGGVFFNVYGVYFYTAEDMIELREKSPATTNPPNLFQKSREDLKAHFGKPQSDYAHIQLFDKPYGCLVFRLKNDKANTLQVFSERCSSVREKHFPKLGKKRCLSGRQSTDLWDLVWSAKGVFVTTKDGLATPSKPFYLPNVKLYNDAVKHKEYEKETLLRPRISLYDNGTKVSYRISIENMPYHFHKGEEFTYSLSKKKKTFEKYQKEPGKKYPTFIQDVSAFISIKLKKDDKELFNKLYKVLSKNTAYGISESDFNLIRQNPDAQLDITMLLSKEDIFLRQSFFASPDFS